MSDLHALVDVSSLQSTDSPLEATFDGIGIGLGHLTLDGAWLRVNEPLCVLLGYSAAELLGHSVQKLIHPADWAVGLLNWQRLQEGAHRYSLRVRCLRKDCSQIWMKVTVSLLRDQTGAPLCFVAAWEDITTLVETECALQYSEARFQRAHMLTKPVAAMDGEPQWLTKSLYDVIVALAEANEKNAVLDHILAAVATVVTHETSAIVLLDGEMARITHLHGFDGETAEHLLQHRFSIQETICAKLKERRQPIQLTHTLLVTAHGLTPMVAAMASFAPRFFLTKG